MNGRLIIIESGTDGSGKATQTKLLCEKLSGLDIKVKKITFPNYESESSSLVKMYLRGEFGKNPSEVNPYAASAFYSVDRFASYKMDWEVFLKQGGIVISDRYTTSNMVHQAAKIQDEQERDSYLKWLSELEYEKFGLPVPSRVFFLDMPPEITQKLMENRANKITGEAKKDIHESNKQYLQDSYNNSLYIAKKYNWEIIKCVENGIIRTPQEIHEEIYTKVLKVIEDSF